MRKLTVLLIMLFSVELLFASWQIGNYVDDFGDNTGEHFAYTWIDGNFSNSATSNSNCRVRIIGNINAQNNGLTHMVTWEFEIHEYGNNPPNGFYSDSSAVIRVKDDAGKVYTFKTSNTEYFKNWNCLTGQDAITFYNLITSNKNIKVAISIENTKYNFTIGCSDAKPILDDLYMQSNNSLDIETYTVWGKVYWEKEVHEAMISIFGDYPAFYWQYEDCKKNDNIVNRLSFSVDSKDMEKNGYPNVSIYLYQYSTTDGRFYLFNADTDKIKAIRFSCNGENFLFTNPTFYSSGFHLDTKWDRFINTAATSPSVTLRIDFSNTSVKSESFVIDGQELYKVVNSL